MTLFEVKSVSIMKFINIVFSESLFRVL